MVAKQRVDVAVEKYKAMLGVFEQFEFTLKDLYDPKVFSRIQKHLVNYLVSGKDKDGLEVMWIASDEVVEIEDEQV